MAFTHAPAAKQALLNLIQARPNLAAVQTGWGHPGDNIDPNETLFVDRVKVTQDWDGFGGAPTAPTTRVKRVETFTIEIVAIVGRTGNSATDQYDAEQRAWALMEECELAVRADITLQGTVLYAGITDFDETTSKGPQGWVALITAKVACKAQVRD